MPKVRELVKRVIGHLPVYRLALLYQVLFNDFKSPNYIRKTEYGIENPYKVFYVIGFPRNEQGLFWIILCNLSHIAYALKHKYIPIIDMQNYANQYLAHTMLHRENSWEYYFEQPAGYSLEKIANSKCILIFDKEVPPMLFDYYNFVALESVRNKGRISYFKRLYSKYIRFDSNTEKYLQSEYDQILRGKGKIMGVLCRGSDYVLRRPPSHPVQPDPLDVIERTKRIMSEKSCAYLYLATEDEEIYELFRSVFKDRLLTNNQMRFRQQDMQHRQYLCEIQFDRTNDRYLRGLEYLTSIYLLSKCDYFIGGLTAGTMGAHLMSSGFEYDYVYDLGIYPDKK